MRRALACLVVLGICLAGAHKANAQLLCYALGFTGPNGPATFYTVDLGTGAATVVGPVGFERCSGMDTNAAGTVFATCERNDGSDTEVLITIDPASGAGTEVGPLGAAIGGIPDISFRPHDGTLFANTIDITFTFPDDLATINTGTGAATIIGPTGLFLSGSALAFSAGGTLFFSGQGLDPAAPDLYTFDPATGASTFVQPLTIPLPPPASFAYRFNAMDFDPVSGLLFAVLNDGLGGGGPRFLSTIDIDTHRTGTVTIIGQTEDTLDALACVLAPVVGVPTLPQWGMILLVLSLLAMATWQLAGQLALSGVGTGGTTIVLPEQRWLSSLLLGQAVATCALLVYRVLVGSLVAHDGVGALLAGVLIGVMIEGYRRERSM